MNTQERDALKQELLEYRFGCHPDPQSLEARLLDPEVAAILREVDGLADTLDAAAREAVPTLKLTPPSDAEPSSSRETSRFGSLRRIAAGILFLILVLPIARYGWCAFEAKSFERHALRVVLSGPGGIPDATGSRFRVETWDVHGEPKEADVTWRVLDPVGAVLESDHATIAGALDIEIGAHLATARRIEVTARAGDTEESASILLARGGGTPLVHITTDKPAYRPGETIRVRGVFLDRLTLEPLEHLYRMRLVDTRDMQQQATVVAASGGVGAVEWTLGQEVPGGNWAVELRSADDSYTLARHEILVRAFERSALEKDITLDRASYLPGERGTASVIVKRLVTSNQSTDLSGIAIDAAVVIDGNEVWTESARTDQDGRATFAFEISQEVERGEARFTARVTDGGVVETVIEPFIVPTGLVDVTFHPEGGDLVNGLPTRVYVEVTDTLGRPLDAAGSVVDDKGHVIARFESEHEGRGSFDMTPRAGSSYQLILDGPGKRAKALPIAKDTGVTLAARDEVIAAGDAAHIRLHSTESGPWIVGAFCRGVLVGHDTLEGTGPHDIAIALPQGLSGVLRITAFDHELAPVAERLVQREADRRIAIELVPEHDTIGPGETQGVSVTTRDEEGRPVAAVVGLTVNDGSVRAMVGDRRIGLVDAVALAADVEGLEGLDDLLADECEPRHIDLALGTRGWRRFVWNRPADDVIEEHGEEARRVLAREGRPRRPLVRDSGVRHAAALSDLQFATDEAFSDALALYGLIVLVSLFAGVAFAGSRIAKSITGSAPIGYAIGGIAAASTLFLLAGAFIGFGGAASGVAAKVAFLSADTLEIEEVEGWSVGSPPTVTQSLNRGLAPQFLAGWFDPIDSAGLEIGNISFFVPPAAVLERELSHLEDTDGLALRVALADEVAFITGLTTTTTTTAVSGSDVVLFELQAFPRRRAVRAYSHRRQGNGQPRRDFTDMIFWDPALKTDADGRATVSFEVSDSLTTWDVVADAHGTRRVGQETATFASVLPLQIDVRMPIEASAGDALQIPVTITTNGEGPSFVALQTKASGAAACSLREDLLVDLDAKGSGSVLLPLDVLTGDSGNLTVTARWGKWADDVTRTLKVTERGFPHRVVRSGVMDGVAEMTIPFPHTLDGGARASVRVFPSPLATIGENLDELLRQPHGCFEQTSSTNHPNVLVLSFLEATGGAAPEVAARARKLLRSGYDRLVGFECSRRGYEWYGANPGHEALTAYGLIEFHDMKQVHPVDAAMVERTREWLLSRRDGDGGFRPSPDSFGANVTTMSTYATYALVSTGTAPEQLKSELDRVERLALESDDAYVVAVAACALHAAERHDAARATRARLARMQQADGSLTGAASSITWSGPRDRTIEATSFAALAWNDHEADAPHVTAALRFLLSQRSEYGGFGATQATIMALKALTAHAQSHHRPAPAGEILVRVGDRVVASAPIREGATKPVVLDGLAAALTAGENDVVLEFVSDDDTAFELPWIFDLEYRSKQPANGVDSPLEISVGLGNREVVRGDTTPLRVRVRNRTTDAQPSPIAIVGLPAGLEVEARVLDALRDAGLISQWEQRGRELVFYWRELAGDSSHEFVVDATATIPGRSTGTASRAWLYYAPETRVWSAPRTVLVTP